VHSVEIMTSAGPARVVLEKPVRPPVFLAVLTHGSGGTPDTPDVLAVRDAALAAGAVTALVTQPYQVRGARAPGSTARQDAAWAEIVATLNEARLPLVQGGRSNGARVVCRTARQVNAAGVIALAFPVHPPGRLVSANGKARLVSANGKAQPGKSRDSELRAAGTSVLVVNGDRDPFGVPEPDDSTRVVVLPGETHALSKNPSAIREAVAGWLSMIPGLGRGEAVVPRLSGSLRQRVPGGRGRSDGAVRSSPRLAAVHRCPRRPRHRCRAGSNPARGDWLSCVPPRGPVQKHPGKAECAGTCQCLLAFSADHDLCYLARAPCQVA
jgi:predicted alpha/beta-hydrolase family hydrolase